MLLDHGLLQTTIKDIWTRIVTYPYIDYLFDLLP